mgnify:CR=1 FL=1
MSEFPSALLRPRYLIVLFPNYNRVVNFIRMRQLSEALQLDEQYMALHPANFRKCISEEEKERYKKQLYNIFTRRNSHIQDDVQ